MAKLTKERRFILYQEYAKVWHSDYMIEHCVKQASDFIEIDGIIIVFDKDSIKTDFWFGEHTYDYDEVCQRADDCSKSEAYFIAENMRQCDAHRHLELLDDPRWTPYLHSHAYTDQEKDCKLGYVSFYRDGIDDRFSSITDYRPLDPDEIDVYRAACESEVAKFEKRLRTYLKRYGLSKCHYGVFWADR